MAMTDKTRLEADRLSLRALRATDAAKIADLANDLDIVRMTGSMPFPFSLADAEALIVRGHGMDLARERLFAIETGEDGLVGTLGFYDTGSFGPELGYWLGRPYWGRGYATEAAASASQWAHDEWEKAVVVAGHFADNPASGVVLCKAGFLYTGEVQMHASKARPELSPSRMMVRLA